MPEEQIKIIQVLIDKLKPAEYNPRQMTEKQAQDLTESIKEFGLVDPLIVNSHKGRENVVVGGHQRLKIATILGFKSIPVVYVDLDEKRERELNLRLNRNLGEWNYDLLANFSEEELNKVGFESEELDKIFQLDAGEDDFDAEAEAEKITECKVKTGDLYQLGEHRLLCGDSTKKEDVEKLMAGEKADMVFTDPPYGLKVVKNNQIGGGGKLGFVGATGAVKARKYRNVINDETTETAKKVYLLCEDLGFKNQIIWGGQYFTEFLPTKGCWIVWDKKEGDFDNTFSDCELAWTSFDGRTYLYRHLWAGLLRKGNRDIELKERVHPTQKPVGLLGQILNDFTKRDDIVLDLFGGSGSTLIACEQLNRKCYMCEIDNKYVQVILNRWSKLTGKQWKKI